MFVYLSTRGRDALRLVMLWMSIALTLGLWAPALASAAPSTGLARETFKPWIDDSTPWDGNWGAFNKTQSERLGGSCALDEKQRGYLTAFKVAITSDWKKLSGDKKYKDGKNKKGLAAAFKKAIQSRLSDGSGPGDKKNGDIAKLSDNLITSEMRKAQNLDELLFLLANNNKTRSCDDNATIFNSLLSLVKPDIFTLFRNMPLFVMQFVTMIPALIATSIYAILSPIALGLALTTPHSERGDHMLHSFSPTTAKAGKKCEKSGGKGYAGDAELGFTCGNLNQNRQSSNVWIRIANSLRSVLSAVYGIIVIGVSLLYLFRRNAQSQYNVRVVLPRLFAAVAMAGFAPLAIGTAISFSNWTVQGIFQQRPGSVPSQIYAAIMGVSVADWSSVGFTGMFAQALVGILPVVLICLFAYVFVMMFIAAIVKQLALILLIIATPVACLSFIFASSMNFFNLWIRGLLAVISLPIIMALILAVGMELSNAFFNPDNDLLGSDVLGFTQTVSRFVAAGILGAAGVLSVRVLKHMRGFVTGNSQSIMRKWGSQATDVGGKLAGLGVGMATGNPMAGVKVAKAGSFASKMIAEKEGGGGGSKWLPQGGGMLSRPTAPMRRMGPSKIPTGDLDKRFGSMESVVKQDKIANARTSWKDKLDTHKALAAGQLPPKSSVNNPELGQAMAARLRDASSRTLDPAMAAHLSELQAAAAKGSFDNKFLAQLDNVRGMASEDPQLLADLDQMRGEAMEIMKGDLAEQGVQTQAPGTAQSIASLRRVSTWRNATKAVIPGEIKDTVSAARRHAGGGGATVVAGAATAAAAAAAASRVASSPAPAASKANANAAAARQSASRAKSASNVSGTTWQEDSVRIRYRRGH